MRIVYYLVIVLLVMVSSVFAQFYMDGKETDWAKEPVLISAPDNTPGGFPEVVKAAVNNAVDVKEVKATIENDIIYTQIKFWGGPAWPNNAYTEVRDGVPSVRHRGYYHLGIDMDNDGSTGANSFWYEAHLTPVGYLKSIGVAVDSIGAEAAIYWGCDIDWGAQTQAKDAMKVKYVEYAWMDWSDTKWENDDDQSKTIVGSEVPGPNYAKSMAWSGMLPVAGSDVELFNDDSTSTFYAGHGWGHNFIEMAFDLRPLQMYWSTKDYFTAGKVWGVAPMIETPLDDWAIDQTTRGEVIYPGPAAVMPFVMDGKETDWAGEPVLISAPDNTPGGFPEVVKAAVNNVVDVKEVKAKVVDDIIYTQIKFWGGPAWPNNAYTEVRDGVPSVRHRGYYHLGIDMDNDGSTGANSFWYEAHLTPVGYLKSIGVAVDSIGAEAAIYWGCDIDWGAQTQAKDAMKVKYVEYAWMDWSDTKWENDDDQSKTIVGSEVPYPDYTKSMAWSGLLPVAGSDVEMFNDDTTSAFYAGHGWGPNFIEMAFDLRPLQQYFSNKAYFQAGAKWGVAPMIETPLDDWAIDQTTRGELVYPGPVVARPFVMDGLETDWAKEPVLISAPDNTPGGFPEVVKAAVNNVVDVKEVKAKVVDDVIYTQIKFWGGPAWPNNAYTEVRNGVPSVRHRGYYHLGIDMDNDGATGANSFWYEAHLTPVGYLKSIGVAVDSIGAEAAIYWGCDIDWGAQTQANADMKVKYVEYAWMDWSDTKWENDDDQSKTIVGSEVPGPSYAKSMAWSGMLPVAGSDVEMFNDDTTSTFYAGHGWGPDFLEMAFDLRPLKMYWSTKDYFTDGKVWGIAPMIETPLDDWAIDQTTRGVLVYNGSATAVERHDLAKVDEFQLFDNYPNPFNPTTSIMFSLPTSSHISLSVYNMLGQKVRTLVDEKLSAGSHTVSWNGQNEMGQPVSSGIYLYRIEGSFGVKTKKMTFMK